jgi:hypothetical protein
MNLLFHHPIPKTKLSPKKIALKIYVQREQEKAPQSGTIFVLCQDTLIQSFRELWGKKEGTVLTDGINDRIRLIGVLLGQEKHQIDYKIILGMKLTSTKRVDSDNPAVRQGQRSMGKNCIVI